jgi:pRiA4b ORF-3-like protein
MASEIAVSFGRNRHRARFGIIRHLCRTMDLMPTANAPASTYELKISLADIAPPIWRRVHVPSDMKLCCLHSALQVVMGWTDSHLHQFEKDGIKGRARIR